MAYDRELAARVRSSLEGLDGVTERSMFGGLAFLVHGTMAVAASSTGGIMVRVDPAEADALLELPGVAPMVMRGSPMTGWLTVAAGAVEDDRGLRAWVDRGVAVALAPKD